MIIPPRHRSSSWALARAVERRPATMEPTGAGGPNVSLPDHGPKRPSIGGEVMDDSPTNVGGFLRYTPGKGLEGGVTGGRGSTTLGLGFKVGPDGRLSFGVATGGANGGSVHTPADAKGMINNLGKSGGEATGSSGRNNGDLYSALGPDGRVDRPQPSGGGGSKSDHGKANDLGPPTNEYQPGKNSNGNDGPSEDPSKKNPNEKPPENAVADNKKPHGNGGTGGDDDDTSGGDGGGDDTAMGNPEDSSGGGRRVPGGRRPGDVMDDGDNPDGGGNSGARPWPGKNGLGGGIGIDGGPGEGTEDSIFGAPGSAPRSGELSDACGNVTPGGTHDVPNATIFTVTGGSSSADGDWGSGKGPAAKFENTPALALAARLQFQG